MFRYSDSTYPFCVVDVVVVVDCHDFVVMLIMDSAACRAIFTGQSAAQVLSGYLTDHKSVIWIFDRP